MTNSMTVVTLKKFLSEVKVIYFFTDHLHVKFTSIAKNKCNFIHHLMFMFLIIASHSVLSSSVVVIIIIVIIYFISISKTNGSNKAPEQPIDMRMKKDNKAKV